MKPPTKNMMRIMTKTALIDLVMEGDPKTCRHAWAVLKERFHAFVDARFEGMPSLPQQEICFSGKEAAKMAEAIEETQPRLSRAIRIYA